MFQEWYNTNLCYYHPEYTHDLDPPDSSAGNNIMFWLEFYPDECIWDYGKV